MVRGGSETYPALLAPDALSSNPEQVSWSYMLKPRQQNISRPQRRTFKSKPNSIQDGRYLVRVGVSQGIQKVQEHVTDLRKDHTGEGPTLTVKPMKVLSEK